MAIATVAEAMSVARGLGIEIVTVDPEVPWRRAWEGLPYGFKASMLQSIEKGSQTEVDVIHGAVCRGGRQVGVATPINDTLLAAVKGLERRLELYVADTARSGESSPFERSGEVVVGLFGSGDGVPSRDEAMDDTGVAHEFGRYAGVGEVGQRIAHPRLATGRTRPSGRTRGASRS